jgi:opacity protein-like surface antigen
MIHRKYVVTALVLCSAWMFGTTSAHTQQTAVGVGIVYASDIGDFDLGFQVNGYVALEQVPGLRIGGDFTYYLPQSESESWMGETVEWSMNLFAINVNAQYFFLNSEEFGLYGLGGLSFARLSASLSGLGESDSDSNTEMGVNLGGGGEFRTGFGSVFGELKFVTGDYDRTVLAVGVRFPL